MATVKIISTEGTVAQQIGNDMIVQTAPVPAREQYLTVVLIKGMPFDLAVSDTVEQAFKEHQAFVDAAVLIADEFGDGGLDGLLQRRIAGLLN